MKRMLFNATQAEELRVAIVDGQKLIDLDIESSQKEQRKGSIFKGVITRVEPSLEACFVDYGTDRHGFLPFKEINRSYFQSTHEEEQSNTRNKAPSIKEGTEILVQVDKDERGNKGAALTSFISLAGRYLVLMPNNPRGGGVSRRIEGEERNELKETLGQLNVPEGMSLIARTAGIGRNGEELQWDLDYLLQLWSAIDSASKDLKAPTLIYQESSLVIRAIRDYFQPDIGEILIDTPDIYEQAKQFMGHVMPHNVTRVHLYQDDIPLFSRFQIEHQIETAHSRQVSLSSGGAIVIDHTEALVSIDVNSARATRGTDIETTAFNTNLEAAEEVARQLRLRDLGGLIVIDFIDMENGRNQRDVENRLRDSLRYDRARVQVGKISRFGLLELSRQRLRPSLGESTHIACPRCNGLGHIRGVESIALHVLRLLQEEALKGNAGQLIAQVPVDVATYLLNEKRTEVHELETRLKISILLLPNKHLETPNFHIQKIKHDDLIKMEGNAPSFQRIHKPEEDTPATRRSDTTKEVVKQEAAVKGITPTQPAPSSPQKGFDGRVPGKDGILQRLWTWLVGDAPLETANNTASTPARTPSRTANAASPLANAGNGHSQQPRQSNREPREAREPRENRSPNERGERQERTERPARQERGEPRAAKPTATQRDENENRENNKPARRERTERTDRPERNDNQNRERPSTQQNRQENERERSHTSTHDVEQQPSLIVASVQSSRDLDTRREPSNKRSAIQGQENAGRRQEREAQPENNAVETTSTQAQDTQPEERQANSRGNKKPSRERQPRESRPQTQENGHDDAPVNPRPFANESALGAQQAEATSQASAVIIPLSHPKEEVAAAPVEPLLNEKDIVGKPPELNLAALPEAQGLVMVETSLDNALIIEATPIADTTPKGRRAPRRQTIIAQEPMMQVETGAAPETSTTEEVLTSLPPSALNANNEAHDTPRA